MSTRKKGRIVNLFDNKGETVLHKAAKNGNLEVVNLLLTLAKERIDLNRQNANGTTPLFIAAQKGHTEVVKLLIENGADVNAAITAEGRYKGLTPLQIANKNGRTEVVKLLKQAEEAKKKGNQGEGVPSTDAGPRRSPRLMGKSKNNEGGAR